MPPPSVSAKHEPPLEPLRVLLPTIKMLPSTAPPAARWWDDSHRERPARMIGGVPAPALSSTDNPAIDQPPSGVNAVLLIVTWWQLGDQAGINTYHFQVVVPGAGTVTLRDIALLFTSQVTSLQGPLVCATANYRATGIAEIFPVKTALFWTPGGVAPGTGGGSPAPLALCGLVRRLTASPVKGNRGRLYVPFLALTDLASGNVPTAAYFAKLQAFAPLAGTRIQVAKGPDALEMKPILYSRSPKHPGQVTDVTMAEALNVVAIQRRRGAFGRPNAPPV